MPGFLDRLKKINPIRIADNEIRSAVEDKVHAAVRAALEDVQKVSPEVADLLAGQEIELVVTARISLQVRQKGEGPPK